MAGWSAQIYSAFIQPGYFLTGDEGLASERITDAVDYARQVVFIKWIGSHADYDHIDAAKVSYAGKTDQK